MGRGGPYVGFSASGLNDRKDVIEIYNLLGKLTGSAGYWTTSRDGQVQNCQNVSISNTLYITAKQGQTA